MRSLGTVFVVILIALLLVNCRGERPTRQAGAEGKPGSASGGSSAASEPSGTPDLGDKMPKYEAKHLNGSVYRLSDQRSKVVLLNVWATWCGPCRYEIPELQAIHEKYAARGFEVVGVSIDDPGMESDVRTFVQEKKMTYPVVLDPQGKIAELFETTVIPTSVLVDREGTIVWMHRGIVHAGDRALQQALQKAL